MYDITVIMPIYNTDKYLKEAIESIKSEKLRVEIIVIDDNSNEKTKKAIKKIIEEKENVFLIENEENKKQGYSRNVGIKQAKGEYIVFLDSDDLVHERFIDTLYENAKENNSDFSMCEWSFIKENRLRKKKNYAYMNKKVLLEEECEVLLKEEVFFTVNKMYKKKFLIENNIFFGEGYFYEDVEFYVKVAQSAKKISIVNEILYYVRINPYSTTRTNKENNTHTEDFKKAVEATIKILNLRSEYSKYFVNRYFITKILEYAFERAGGIDKKKYIKEMVDLINATGTEYKIPGKIILKNGLMFRKRFLQEGKVNALMWVYKNHKNGRLEKFRKAKNKIVLQKERRKIKKNIESKVKKLRIKKHYMEEKKKKSNGYYRHLESKIENEMILYETFHGGRFTGNPYAMFVELYEKYKGYKHIIVINDEKDKSVENIKKLRNVILVKREDGDYIKYLAVAKYLINDTTFPFYFNKRKEQIYINTWHGTPIKTLGNDVKGSMGQQRNAIKNFLQTDFMINPNKFTENIMLRSHGIEDTFPGQSLITGYPRVDLTFKTTKENEREKIEKILGRKIKEKIVLYAPTWRGETGNVSDSTERLKSDVEEIMKDLNEDTELLIKVHHLSYDFLIENGKELSDIVIPEYYETNELLNAVDVLITDYSSIFFEYIPLKRPIIYYVYDKESYISERGLYLDLEELPGVVKTDVNEVSKLLKSNDLEKVTVNEKYDEFIKEYCPFDDGGSTKRIIDLIFEEKLEKEKKPKKKTTKLIYGGSLKDNAVTEALINYLEGIDYSKNSISIVTTKTDNEEILNNIERINENVNILFKVGDMAYNKKEYKIIKELKNEVISSKINSEEIKKIYSKEFRRIFGDVIFDELIDFSGYSQYWSYLFTSMDETKKILVVHSDLTHLKKDKDYRKTFEVIPKFDEIVALSDEIIEKNKKTNSIFIKKTN